MPDDRDLRSALHSEAERHLPDRDAMLDRINKRRNSAPNRLRSLFRPVAPGPRRVLTAARPVAAAVAVAGLLVAGITGINLAGRTPAPDPQVAASPDPAAITAAPTKPPPKSPTAPGAFLTAIGSPNSHSIPNWTQSDLVLTTTGTITALDVTVRIAKTADVNSTGRWTSVPESMMTITVSSSGKALVYRFTLNAGATLAPGHYTFAAQYNHATHRSVAADSYDATATAGTTVHLKGGYTG
ncbi:hypothetical protein GCM10010172_44570 [Paractinoplanes ferrugineus]|uniref:Uncharacterized protein n=1 Tax=Paractinoplanes ferrugineus TaxID=113564 RepID=A0A919J321_9ACTN|nr:hypothetical protein [Actinoplanes ferrugineus]GIE13615.1 hypothetical protein Afe05nite_54550 [Actinoplanes ferrugineus]